MIVSMLDEIAWLFNLRASDISYNPGELVEIFQHPNAPKRPIVFISLDRRSHSTFLKPSVYVQSSLPMQW